MRLKRMLGSWLYRLDETGHSRLCRLLHWIAHDGPHGTFVLLDTLKLESGGHLCSFGVECGDPTKSYTRQMNERMEAFQHMSEMLQKSGALHAHIWENPRFSAAGLCDCGRKFDRKLPNHKPLCSYRIEHGCEVTIEEYKSALRKPTA